MKVMSRKKVMFTGLAAGAALCAFGLTAIPGNVHKLAAVQAEHGTLRVFRVAFRALHGGSPSDFYNIVTIISRSGGNVKFLHGTAAHSM